MRRLLRYSASEITRMLLLLVGVSILAFWLIISSPIDPVDAYVGSESSISQEQRDNVAEYWGLNDPAPERYATWVGHMFEGDMGTSIVFQKPVIDVIGERFVASVALLAVAWLLSGVLGFLLGVVSGAMQGRVVDRIIKTVCFVFASTPVFWVGLILLMVFAVSLGWFPIGLAVPIGKAAGDVTFWERLHHLALPALTLSVTGIANIALHTRQKMIDVLKSNYVLYAMARGESKWTIVRRHGLRNIALPALTLQFASFSELFGGSLLAETVFSYPGLGSAVSSAAHHGDVPLLLGVSLFAVLFVFVGNLTANLLYGVFNPQIRMGEKVQ